MNKANENMSLKWCPEADLNHRHADFQSRAISGCSIASEEKTVKPLTSVQSLSPDLSNSDCALENAVDLRPCFKPQSDEARIIEAARWVSKHRDEIKGPLIAVIKERFGLKAIHAIEVAKRSSNFEYSNLTEMEYSIILLLVEYRELKITEPCEVIGRTLGFKLKDTQAALDGLIARHLIEYAHKNPRSNQARYKLAGGA